MGAKLCINVKGSDDIRISSPPFEKDENCNGIEADNNETSVSSAPKVPLAQGKGLMDWIRLTNSGKDLTGTGGKLLKVTEEELKAHSDEDNAWMVINGKVYNVAPYMQYHPGGVDQLMLGAGSDGTDLFNEIHPWVNYESMLKACLVGQYVGSRIKNRRRSSVGSIKRLNSLSLGLSTTSGKAAKKSTLAEHGLEISWKDRDGIVEATIATTKWDKMDVERFVVELSQESVCSKLRIVFRPQHASPVEVKWEVMSAVHVSSLKVQKLPDTHHFLLSFAKDSSVAGGSGVSDCDNILPTSVLTRPNPKYRKFKLVSKEQVTHDTFLFELEPPDGCLLPVPVGHHVFLRINVEGMLLTRPYTPVNQDLDVLEHKTTCLNPQNLYLMIKIYSDGAVTPSLAKLNNGDTIDVSDPEGVFYADNLAKWTDLAMIAAGTGFTPMVRVCRYWLDYLSRKSPKLLFFNKSSKDILWREELNQMSRTHSDLIEVRYILSDPEPSWRGLKGRVNQELLKEALVGPSGINKPSKNQFVCICGPPKFTEATFGFLKEMGYMESQIHLFLS